MANDKEFIPGLLAKAPHEKAPEYVKARLSIKREELLGYLQSLSDEWVNVDVKVSQGGKWYAEKDNWKPESKGGSRPNNPGRGEDRSGEAPAQTSAFPDDDIPF